MSVIILLILGIILTIISIILIVTRQSAAAAIISAIFALLAYFVSLYPTIFNQQKIESNIVLSVNALSLISTDERDLSPIISPDDCDIRWSSDNTNIVSIDNSGHLKALEKGNATITAAIVNNGVEYTTIYNITVKNPYIKLDPSYLLSIGETSYLSAVTIPEDASIIWSSSNPDIVSVSDNGKIEGILEGTATITATMTYNNKSYSANCEITAEKNIDKTDMVESDEKDPVALGTTPNSDFQESESNSISIMDVTWLDDEKIYKDDFATTTRGEQWSDCIRFGSSNINSDGTAVLRVVCDQKFSKFTAEIAPQIGFDKTETVTFYIYGVCNDEQIFKDEFSIDYSNKPFKVECDLSNVEELYFWKAGNYNQGRIAGQYINGYSGMGVLMHDTILYR